MMLKHTSAWTRNVLIPPFGANTRPWISSFPIPDPNYSLPIQIPPSPTCTPKTRTTIPWEPRREQLLCCSSNGPGLLSLLPHADLFCGSTISHDLRRPPFSPTVSHARGGRDWGGANIPLANVVQLKEFFQSPPCYTSRQTGQTEARHNGLMERESLAESCCGAALHCMGRSPERGPDCRFSRSTGL